MPLVVIKECVIGRSADDPSKKEGGMTFMRQIGDKNYPLAEQLPLKQGLKL